MRFADITGNADVCRALAGMVDSGKVPHALMLHEDDGGGAMSVALAFLQYLYCRQHTEGDSCDVCPTCNKIRKMIHPDVRFVFPVNTGTSLDYLAQWRQLVLSDPYFTENSLAEALEIEGKSSMIKVEESKGILDMLSLSALERGYRAVVIYLPERMNKEAANRLLKAVEEPPALTQFVLITHSPESVMTTIRSRCQLIRVLPPHRSLAAAPAQERELMSGLMQALLSKDLLATLEAADAIGALPSREKAKSFCKFAADRLRYIFLLQQQMDVLAPLPEDELEELRLWASKCRKSFPRKGAEALGRAQTMIGRNVNVKIVFTELAGSLFLAI